MESKKITLALHPGLYALLKERANKRFMGVQQLIYDTLQKEFLAPPVSTAKKSNAGRPKLGEDKFLKYFTRDR